jgi:ribosome-binding ATPase YchF (GTP1/OBG family)
MCAMWMKLLPRRATGMWMPYGPVIEKEGCEMLVIAAQSEAEIAQLDDESDRKAFLQDLGLEEPGVNKLIRAAYKT